MGSGGCCQTRVADKKELAAQRPIALLRPRIRSTESTHPQRCACLRREVFATGSCKSRFEMHLFEDCFEDGGPSVVFCCCISARQMLPSACKNLQAAFRVWTAGGFKAVNTLRRRLNSKGFHLSKIACLFPAHHLATES